MAAVLRAQEPAALERGSRIRLTVRQSEGLPGLRTSQRIVGTLEGVDRNQLVVRSSEGETFEVPFDVIRDLHMSRGHQRRSKGPGTALRWEDWQADCSEERSG